MTKGLVAPLASSHDAHNRMLANRRRDTKPELLLRSALHRSGMRFRVDFPPIKGLRRRADIVFPRSKVAVFIDGCYWHGCPLHGTIPKTNTAFWREKIGANQIRDAETNARLEEAGWIPIRIWEHDAIEESVARIQEILLTRTQAYS